MLAVKNETGTVGVIRIYSTIWEDSWWFRDVEYQIRQLAAQCTELEVRIHTYGGDVFNAIGIHNLLKSLNLKVTAYIDGVCASAGTIIACAADKVYMYTLGFYMIHLPTIDMYDANVQKAESVINMVKNFTKQAEQMYMKKTGLPEAEVTAMMVAETWLDSATALQKKFIDGIQEASPMEVDLNTLGTAMSANDKIKIFNCFKMADNKNPQTPPAGGVTPPKIDNAAGGGANTPTPIGNSSTGLNNEQASAAVYFSMLPKETRDLIVQNAAHLERMAMLIEKYGAGEVSIISNEIGTLRVELGAKEQKIKNQENELAALRKSIRIAKVTNAQKEGKITAQEAETFMGDAFGDEQVDAVLGMRKPMKRLSDAINPGLNSATAGKTYLQLSEENPDLLEQLRKENPAEYARLHQEASGGLMPVV
jgi:ATP-dependent protease ClpP protease subunit